MSRRRRLGEPGGRRLEEIAFNPDTARVYRLNDVDCPESATEGSTCQTVSGSFDLYVSGASGADLDQIYENYQRFTQDAIDDGELQEELEKVDSLSGFVIEGAVDPPSATTIRIEEPLFSISEEEESDDDGIGSIEIILIIGAFGIALGVAIAAYRHFNATGKVGTTQDEDAQAKYVDATEALTGHNEEDDIYPTGVHSPENPFRRDVEVLVKRNCPDQIDNVDTLLRQFAGREDQLIVTLKSLGTSDDYDDYEYTALVHGNDEVELSVNTSDDVGAIVDIDKDITDADDDDDKTGTPGQGLENVTEDTSEHNSLITGRILEDVTEELNEDDCGQEMHRSALSSMQENDPLPEAFLATRNPVASPAGSEEDAAGSGWSEKDCDDDSGSYLEEHIDASNHHDAPEQLDGQDPPDGLERQRDAEPVGLSPVGLSVSYSAFEEKEEQVMPRDSIYDSLPDPFVEDISDSDNVDNDSTPLRDDHVLERIEPLKMPPMIDSSYSAFNDDSEQQHVATSDRRRTWSLPVDSIYDGLDDDNDVSDNTGLDMDLLSDDELQL